MRLKGLVPEDFIQYKKPSMFLICPFCSFKCDIENGTQICQNWSLAKAPIIEVETNKIIQQYLDNPITKAVVFGGLEPLDSFDEVLEFIQNLRQHCLDDVVIYTGYYADEIRDKLEILKNYPNIIVKFGRFIPNQKSRFDDVLGITLASDNQYAEQIS